jgi:hypothetical protein
LDLLILFVAFSCGAADCYWGAANEFGYRRNRQKTDVSRVLRCLSIHTVGLMLHILRGAGTPGAAISCQGKRPVQRPLLIRCVWRVICRWDTWVVSLSARVMWFSFGFTDVSEIARSLPSGAPVNQ